jgi:hypothetical protein
LSSLSFFRNSACTSQLLHYWWWKKVANWTYNSLEETVR